MRFLKMNSIKLLVGSFKYEFPDVTELFLFTCEKTDFLPIWKNSVVRFLICFSRAQLFRPKKF